MANSPVVYRSHSPLPLASTEYALSSLSQTLTTPSTSTSSNSSTHLIAHLRSANRSSQSSLNQAKSKVNKARLDVEKAEVELRMMKMEMEAMRKRTEVERYEPIHTQADLLPLEEFLTNASEELKSSLPNPDHPEYTQALILARLRFELEGYKRREDIYASTQNELNQTKNDVLSLKYQSIKVDTDLESLNKAVEKLQGSLKEMTNDPLEEADEAMNAL